jgi:hypothetical protein
VPVFLDEDYSPEAAVARFECFTNMGEIRSILMR